MIDERVQVSARIEPEARKRLKVKAAEMECTLNDLLETLAWHMDDMPDLPQWIAETQ